ncbi:MAG: proline--tRNA ligase [Bacilli bacterium]|nr:proline--tRNA ligase [Bacilli bacterium]
MKLKNSFFYTIRENIKDEDSISGNLLVRSGMIKKTSSGIYMYLPLGLKVLKNIENIIREEMNRINAEEVLMPSLINKEVYESSNRLSSFGNSMFSLKDRYEKDYVLGPTHEEMFTMAALNKVRSFKDLPFSLYQIQTKYRDEARARYGLIRVREFLMKDAYSFDKDLDSLDISYNGMFNAYKKIFTRLGINYKVVKADTGSMGGLLSEEFQAITDIGEDIVVYCDSCDYASNIEVSESIVSEKESSEKKLEKDLVETKDAKTIEEVSEYLNEAPSKLVKTLIYKIDGKLYALLVKGDSEVNETKVLKLLNAENIELASEAEVKKVTRSEIGFVGPISIDVPIIIDNEVSTMINFIVGANKKDYHYKNVNIDDFNYIMAADIRNVKEGDMCPKCGSPLKFKKGIEIGNTFKLGTKYSECLNLKYNDIDNDLKPVWMGCYGIGIGRCLSAIVEQKNDDKGIIWPMSIAPYKVAIVVVDINNEKQLETANHLYNTFKEAGIDVLLDDRAERAGVKFNDMDLIGIPIRITIGRKVDEHIVELKKRCEEEFTEISLFDVLYKVQDIIEEENI